MTFLDKARRAAEQARQSASQGIANMTSTEAQDEMRETATQLGVQFRGAADQAKRGLITAIEKIDPGVLADLVIKATAIQETANRALRAKGSTYRIGEITVTATIPPQIGFSIARIGDEEADDDAAALLTSSELAPTIGAVEEVVTLEGEIIEPAPAS